MPTIREVKTELRHREWGEQIQECQNSGMTVTAWCKEKGMTNNLAERTVKPFVIDRKNFLFSATDKGADASALFMSVIETAKRNGLNVFGYLSYLMLVLLSWGKTPSEEQLDSIMPWSATLPETCHRTYHQIVENMAEVK